MTISHDHLIECSGCGGTVADIRDCTCSGTGHSYAVCGHCKEQREYDRVESARNADY